LLEAGYSHRQTVLIIYGFSALFGLIAILYTKASLIVTLILSIALILLLQAFAEIADIGENKKKPLLNIVGRTYKRKEVDYKSNH